MAGAGGYYLPSLLWREELIAWANLSVQDGRLVHDIGYVARRAPRERACKGAIEVELDGMRRFLGLGNG